MKKVTKIMIHHSAVSYEKNPDQFEATNEYHKAKFAFKSSTGMYGGYHVEISSRGEIRAFREDGEQSAACIGENDGSTFHILLDGNFEIEKPSAPQIYKLRDKLQELAKEFKLTAEDIYFHRDFWNTSCPGKYMDRVFVRSLVDPKVVEREELKIKEGNSKEDIVRAIMEKHAEIDQLLNQLIK